MTSTDTSLATVGSSKPSRPAATLLPIINDLEAKISHHFSISDFQYDLRRRVYRVRPFPFLDLPGEVREKIYEFIWGTAIGYYFSMRLCHPSISIRRHHGRGLRFRRGIALLLVNKQVSREAAYVLYSQTALQIDSAPYRRPENLQFIGSVRTRWFTSTTRCVCIRSNFGFEAERNAVWVKGLKCFEALLSLEVLLDLDIVVEESSLKDMVANLLPFAALKCDSITFRGPPFVQGSTREEVKAAWQEALDVEQTEVLANVIISSCDTPHLSNHFDRSTSYGIISIKDQEELCKPQKPRKLRISKNLTKRQEYCRDIW
jgi:hypothetical protein